MTWGGLQAVGVCMHIARIANARATDATLVAVVDKWGPLLLEWGKRHSQSGKLRHYVSNNLGACSAHPSAAHSCDSSPSAMRSLSLCLVSITRSNTRAPLTNSACILPWQGHRRRTCRRSSQCRGASAEARCTPRTFGTSPAAPACSRAAAAIRWPV